MSFLNSDNPCPASNRFTIEENEETPCLICSSKYNSGYCLPQYRKWFCKSGFIKYLTVSKSSIPNSKKNCNKIRKALNR